MQKAQKEEVKSIRSYIKREEDKSPIKILLCDRDFTQMLSLCLVNGCKTHCDRVYLLSCILK